jgi:DNA-binding transcriptional regulator/RsmH inhibitor MraZ
MKVISISLDRKRAMVICKQHRETVTRHAGRIPGTRDKFTIWNRPSWMRYDDSRVQMTTITIDENNAAIEGATV